MATTPEGKVKKRIKAVCNGYGAYTHMPVQNGMGSPTLDYVGCYYGHYFAVEAKAPGKKPTPRQKLTIKKMEDAGAKVFVIDGDCSELEEWLRTVKWKYEPENTTGDQTQGLNKEPL